MNYMSNSIDSLGNAEAKEAFLTAQQSTNNNSRYWPYTEINPYDSYFNKWRIYLLGETSYEQELRERVAKSYLDKAYLIARYGSSSFPKTCDFRCYYPSRSRNTCFY